jgi:hypothetical protein
MLRFFNYFRTNMSGKKLAFMTKNAARIWNFYHIICFWAKRQFCLPKIVEKRRKSVIITPRLQVIFLIAEKMACCYIVHTKINHLHWKRQFFSPQIGRKRRK